MPPNVIENAYKYKLDSKKICFNIPKCKLQILKTQKYLSYNIFFTPTLENINIFKLKIYFEYNFLYCIVVITYSSFYRYNFIIINCTYSYYLWSAVCLYKIRYSNYNLSSLFFFFCLLAIII